MKTRLIPSPQAFRLRLNIIVASLLLAVSIAVYYASSPPAVHGGSPGSVVVNKYQNSGTTNDILELLVVQNNLDMLGMIVKDFSANMANDDFVAIPISTVQGSRNASAFAGIVVTVTGVVTGLKSNGFFMQTPDAQVDGNPATSEGIFVFTSSPLARRGRDRQLGRPRGHCYRVRAVAGPKQPADNGNVKLAERDSTINRKPFVCANYAHRGSYNSYGLYRAVGKI